MHDSWDPSSNTMLAIDFGRRARGSTSMRHRAIEVSKNEFLDPLERSTKHFKYCMIFWGFGATSPQNDTSIYVPYNDTIAEESSGSMQPASRQRSPPRLIRHEAKHAKAARTTIPKRVLLSQSIVGNDGVPETCRGVESKVATRELRSIESACTRTET